MGPYKEVAGIHAKWNKTNRDLCWFILVLPPGVFKERMPPESELLASKSVFTWAIKSKCNLLLQRKKSLKIITQTLKHSYLVQCIIKLQ